MKKLSLMAAVAAACAIAAGAAAHADTLTISVWGGGYVFTADVETLE